MAVDEFKETAARRMPERLYATLNRAEILS
jgi:hypothetical protein